MKKTIGILLSVLMILNIVIPVYANTSEATLSSSVSIGTETVSEVKRGDTITLTVSMQDCSAAFKSLGLTLVYDEAVFEYVETDTSGNANWTCPITGLFMSAYVAKNKNLATAAMNEINYNGVIFTINLNVKDTAVFGEQIISITPVIKNGQTVIPCSATSVTVEVVCNHVYSDEWTSNADGHYKECTISGCTSKTNEARHEWTHACDTACNICGFTREIEHPYDTTKWENDETNHWRVCSTEGCGAITDVGLHTGGMSDCQTQAVCDVCNQSYGELGGHTLTCHAEQGADHNNTGVAEHWTCDICNKYFSDSMGINEITQDDTIIGKVPHNHDSEWSYSTDKHWKECVCGDKIDVREHQFSNNCDTTCDCGYTRTIQHSWESTYSYNENGHWIECSVCGEIQGTVETHKGGTATCQNKAECSVCHQIYGDFAKHNYTSEIEEDKYLKTKATCKDFAVYYKSCSMCGLAGTETFNGTVKADHVFDNDCDTTCNAGCGYTRTITHQWKSAYSTNDNKHWYECEICGEKKDEGNHSGGAASCKDKAVCEVCNKAYGELKAHILVEKVDAKYLKAEANCVAKAVYYKSCSVCGTASAETFETGGLDSTKHTGETEVKNAEKETCTVDGYSGDVYCKDCGVKLDDGKTVPAGHKTSKVDAAPATSEKDGNIEYFICSDCGKLFSDKEATTEIAIADTVINKTESDKQENEKGESPHTSDTNAYGIWVAILFVGGSVLVGLAFTRKSKRS